MSTEEIVEQTTDVATPDSTTAQEPVQEPQNALDDNTPDTDDEPVNTEPQGAEPSGAEKRIKQLAAQRKAADEARIKAEVEKEYYKGLAEGRSAASQPQQPATQPVAKPAEDLKMPVLDDFEQYDDWEAAKADYYVRLAEQRVMQKFQQQHQQQQFVAQAQKLTSKLEDAAKDDPGFAEIWKNKALWDTLPINQSMADVVTASPIFPEIVKWIHNNRAEAQRIKSLSPLMAARELTLIEASLSAAPKPTPPKKVSAAPQPIQTVNPATSNTIDEDDLPMEEYYRRRTKQMYGR